MHAGPRTPRTPLLVALLAAVLAVAGLATPAGAAVVAPDAQDAVRPIVFPVAGRHTYSDTFGACRSGCTRGHEGTDIMAAKLVPVVAVRDATVTWMKDTATPDGREGNYVMLRDAEGWEYWYIHINNDSPGTDDGANPRDWMFGPGITRGAEVRAGQLVGFVGDSGNAEGTAPHLHFEIHKPDGSVINPYKSLRAASSVSAPLVVTGAGSSRVAFVEALYADFIGWAPTDVELAARLGELADGRSRGEVVAGFARSDEWVRALVDGYYRSTLGREADAAGRTHWIGVLRRGRTAADVAAEFYASEEYFRRVGGTDLAWIADLYGELLLRAPEAGGPAYWVAQLGAGVPRRQIAHAFYQSAETRQVRVTALYDDLLGRAPDHAGKHYWAGVLLDGNDLRLATHLAGSDEYLSRAISRFAD